MTMIHEEEEAPAWLAAGLFRSLADPMRLAILLTLQAGERRVTELGNSQANVSGHLACLKDCGPVADRAQGRANFCRLARPELARSLHAAEQLLAGIGHQVELCPNYSGDRAATPVLV